MRLKGLNKSVNMTSKNSKLGLMQKQSLPLNIKINMTKRRIKEWYEKYRGDVYVSYSGGKDSEVMLDLVKKIYPKVNVVFVDNKMERETRLHAIKKSNIILTPKIPTLKVWNKYGIPFPSKQQANFIYKTKHTKSDYLRSRLMTGIMKNGKKTMFKISNKWKRLINSDIEVSDKCCWFAKKEPFMRYEKQTGEKPFIATMASDGMERKKAYLNHGCFNLKKEQCAPLGFWTDQDILKYIKEFNLDYCKAYGDIIEVNGILKTTKSHRTGCDGCGFGIHLEEEPNRFQRMSVTNPRLHNIILHKWCNGNMGKALDLCGIDYNIIQRSILDYT